MKLRKILSFILALSMVVTLLPSSTFADDGIVANEVSTISENETNTGEEIESGETASVSSSEQLANALSNGATKVVITESFIVDRSFVITKDTQIASSKAVTLTRDPNFAGEFFVVGENKSDTKFQ